MVVQEVFQASAHITLAKKQENSPLRRWRDFYGCSGTLHLAGKALNAVFFASRVSFTVRNWVTRHVNHIIQGYGTNVRADAVSDTTIPIDSCKGSVDTQFSRGFDGSPDFVTVMFANDLAVFLKIRINWHKILHSKV
jgi:hypothetical protein